MVGDKYTRLAPLAGSLLLLPYSGPAVLHEVGEVVYFLAENKMNISTGDLYRSTTVPHAEQGHSHQGSTWTAEDHRTSTVYVPSKYQVIPNFTRLAVG